MKFMFIKINFKMPVSPTDRDAVAKAELELRRRQAEAVKLFREYVPGCEKAFIASAVAMPVSSASGLLLTGLSV